MSACFTPTLILGQSPLSIEVVFQKCNIGFGWVLGAKELFVCRFLEGRRLYVFDYSFHRRDGRAIILDMERVVDVGDGCGGLRSSRQHIVASLLKTFAAPTLF